MNWSKTTNFRSFRPTLAAREGVDLSYDDREAGHLLGAWAVALGLLVLSTTRPAYSPVVGQLVDRLVFGCLVVFVGIGATTSRYRDVALGVPMAVCGGLVVWVVIQAFVDGSVAVDSQTTVAAVGLVGLGGLFVREGILIARGRRHRAERSNPPTGWQWWLGAAVLVAIGSGGL